MHHKSTVLITNAYLFIKENVGGKGISLQYLKENNFRLKRGNCIKQWIRKRVGRPGLTWVSIFQDWFWLALQASSLDPPIHFPCSKLPCAWRKYLALSGLLWPCDKFAKCSPCTCCSFYLEYSSPSSWSGKFLDRLSQLSSTTTSAVNSA